MIQIIGKGGFAREVAAYIKDTVLFFEYDFSEVKDCVSTIIAIGDCEVRKGITKVHPKFLYSYVNLGKEYGNNSIGAGSIICPGTKITVGVTIGKHVIINLNCTIGHDSIIGDFCTISPGANISGNVTIGSGCYIGTNSVIREKITICDNVIIGAGAVVVKDIPEPGVYAGNPCIRIK